MENEIYRFSRVRNTPETSQSKNSVPSTLGKDRFLANARNILSDACQWGFTTAELQNSKAFGTMSENEYAIRRDLVRAEALETVDFEWEMEMVALAYDLSEGAHDGFFRRSERPYFEHPVEVAKILLEDLPAPTAFKVIVGLLHDVIEDSENPDAERERLLRAFREKVLSKRPELLAEFGSEEAETKIRSRLQFVEKVIEAVDALSKKKKESYLSAWERPLLAVENSFSNLAESFSPLAPWMFPFGVPKVWSGILKERSKREYFARMRELAQDQLFFSILMVKFADRLANLRDSDHEELDQIDKIVKETEKEYFVLADIVDPSGFIRGLFEAEVRHLRSVRRLKGLSNATKKAASALVVPGKKRKK